MWRYDAPMSSQMWFSSVHLTLGSSPDKSSAEETDRVINSVINNSVADCRILLLKVYQQLGPRLSLKYDYWMQCLTHTKIFTRVKSPQLSLDFRP